jgi:hypothetical protein
MGFWATTCCCLRPFWWESLRGWDFRPQLIVVSGLFRWESLRGWDFRPQLIVVSGLFSQPLFSFLRWNSGYQEASFTNFSFSRWNSGYQEAFFTNFFYDGTLAIKKPFSQTFLFHDGILAIRKPFSRIFPFSRWNSGYQEAFLTNFSFFTMELWLSGSLSHEFFFFHDGTLEMRNLGENSFHIYHKEYLHRIRLVKNLAS